MTSLRQIEANRRNACLSTGPVTEEGKRKSRQNAVRHGLTAETVIEALEDADDYAAFEMAITTDFEAQSAVERELVLRLASLLWRLRRATAIESGLFKLRGRPDSCSNFGDHGKRVKIATEPSRRYAGTLSRLMKGRSFRSTRTMTLEALLPSRHRTAMLTASPAPSFACRTCPPTHLTA